MIGDHDVSLYFHIPFCSKKCPYCHFFVLPDQPSLKNKFLDALPLEFRLRLPMLAGKRVVSIYMGGGTPSKLTPKEFEAILHPIFGSGLEIAPDCEITIEMNPEDATESLLLGYAHLGINRLSVGIQSLDDQQLKVIDRQHSAQKGMDAVLTAARAGFQNISIDLMYDLPHQTLKSWRSTLKRLQSLPITHLSLYNLTVEPHTGFFRRRKELAVSLPSEEESLNLLQEAILSIEQMGLRRYEISAFARPGRHSQHNTGYWMARPFLGFGPSAFSYWEGKRFSNVAHLSQYATSLYQGILPIDFEEQLTWPKNLYELLAIRIRLKEGVDLLEFQKIHGSLPEECLDRLQALVEREWLSKREGNRYQLTEEGMLFYDSVATQLI